MGLKAAGYTMIDLGRFPEGTMDYTSQISAWKKEKVEIVFANMAPPISPPCGDSASRRFRTQGVHGRQGRLFSSAMEAIGGGWDGRHIGTHVSPRISL